ncbi:MAG: protease modulator HflC [Planctomycetaceae bacterium]
MNSSSQSGGFSVSGPALSRFTDRGPALARWALAAVAVCLAATSIVFVDEGEDVIVETLGRITAVYDSSDPQASDRGLHFKWPWPFGTARRFDRRLQLFDPPGRELFTRDRKNLTVSSYLCWKIAEPPVDARLEDRPVVKFFRGLGAVPIAESRLDAQVRSALATEFGRIELADLLAVHDSEQGPGAASALEQMAERVLQHLRDADEGPALFDRLGIELVDLRIKRINLPEGNRLAVFERMRTERERIAERYRSAGQAERARIESQARRQSDELLARADAEAERIRGEGEAEAIRILNGAHAQDPAFYEFQKTLAAYSKILGDRTTLVLSSGSRLFRLLTEGVPGADEASAVPPPAAAPQRDPASRSAALPADRRGSEPAGGAP